MSKLGYNSENDINSGTSLRPEVWLPVVGYEKTYEASNHGKIRRLPFGKILTPSATNGYLHVSLSQNGEIKTARVGVLVLTAFCGSAPFYGAHAAHNNGDSMNNRLTNLRWATPHENQADVDRHGRRCRGEAVFGAILTEDAVKVIRRRASQGERNKPIAESFGVSISTIHLIRHNRIWKHV